jgi:shikimate kinase
VNEGPPPGAVARVVLLGMMGSGKTTIGRLLGRELGWSFVDLDVRIEKQEGRPIARIFAGEGEAYFRALETAATAELAHEANIVLAPGGGWVATAGNVELLGPGTLTVWLRVSPEEIMRRLAKDGGKRPLLASPDPLGAVRRLSAVRDPLYARADLTIATAERAPLELALQIARLVRSRQSSA